MSEMRFIPKGTEIEEPYEGSRKVVMVFPSHEDAIIFYEQLVSCNNGEQILRIGKPGTLSDEEEYEGLDDDELEDEFDD